MNPVSTMLVFYCLPHYYCCFSYYFHIMKMTEENMKNCPHNYDCDYYRLDMLLLH
ncbi:hypothetical protein [Aeromonas salmonicida]